MFGAAQPGKSQQAGVVQWVRAGERGLIPAEIFDSILLDRFPGRTLEELDQMDVGRYMRALQAKQMIGPERKRAAWLAGVFKQEDITPDEWAMIQEHDRLVSNG
jgi:hypothetical protein